MLRHGSSPPVTLTTTTTILTCSGVFVCYRDQNNYFWRDCKFLTWQPLTDKLKCRSHMKTYPRHTWFGVKFRPRNSGCYKQMYENTNTPRTWRKQLLPTPAYTGGQHSNSYVIRNCSRTEYFEKRFYSHIPIVCSCSTHIYFFQDYGNPETKIRFY